MNTIYFCRTTLILMDIPNGSSLKLKTLIWEQELNSISSIFVRAIPYLIREWRCSYILKTKLFPKIRDGIARAKVLATIKIILSESKWQYLKQLLVLVRQKICLFKIKLWKPRITSVFLSLINLRVLMMKFTLLTIILTHILNCRNIWIT